jgi:formamidopyrimidine-DNA glycosylase
VPELPEVEALTSLLAERMAGRQIVRCELGSFSALKTVSPPLNQLVGRTATGCERRGKYVCFDLDGLWLVIHLARAGWVRWYDKVPTTAARPSKSPLALRVGLDNGSGFDVTEMGTEKRLALWVVNSLDQVEGIAGLGIDPLSPEFTAAELGRRLDGISANVKTALTSQSLIAGVGNAYSDEALHAAHLSPYKSAAKLDPAEVESLHAALVGVLTQAVARSGGLAAADLKGDKKRAMQVHGRTGEACPVCGDTIRQVSFATKSMQYCPTCQTGGRPLADRRLSKLLK